MTKILIDEATVKLVLEYLEESDNYLGSLDHSKPIAALKALAEQPAQQEFVSPGGGYVPAIPAQQRPIKTFHGGKAWPVQELAQQRLKCAVKDCANHSDEGLFVGLLCNPCHTFIKGDGGLHSQAYRNAIAMIDLAIAAERDACAKVCDELRGINWGPEQCATAIRARSNT